MQIQASIFLARENENMNDSVMVKSRYENESGLMKIVCVKNQIMINCINKGYEYIRTS